MAVKTLTAAAVKKSLVDSMGNVSLAAASLGKSRVTIYNYINASDTLKDVLVECRQMRVSVAEDNLTTALLEGQEWATKLTLTTLGKGLGYSTRHELTGPDGGAVQLSEEVQQWRNGRSKRRKQAVAALERAAGQS